tara:strand:+ start:763 stop:1218 length:456 start_codon:yes stop_codon:yes gene_type:complete
MSEAREFCVKNFPPTLLRFFDISNEDLDLNTSGYKSEIERYDRIVKDYEAKIKLIEMIQRERLEDKMIAAIDANPLVGKGTCSVIAECYDVIDLRYRLKWSNSVKEAIEMALDMQEGHLEQGLNYREGNDDDWQLVSYNEFKEKRKEWENV